MLFYNLIKCIQKLHENHSTIFKASLLLLLVGVLFGWCFVLFLSIKIQILPKKTLITEVVNPGSTSCYFPDMVPCKI